MSKENKHMPSSDVAASGRSGGFRLSTCSHPSETQRLRALFPKILEALELGFCSSDCSLDFLEMIPNEVRLVVDRMKRDANQWETQCRVARIQRDNLANQMAATLQSLLKL